MQIVVKRDPPNTIRCPYIPQHLMHIESFLTHLSRCKATNKNQFKICPFNSYHVIPIEKFKEHKDKCVNRIDLDDREEWSCRVMEKAFIAGCGGEDPSNFKDSESVIHQSLSDSSWLSSENGLGDKFGFYQFMNKQKDNKKEQKNVFKKKKPIDHSFTFKQQQFENSQDQRQFNRNFYDFCPKQPKSHTNEYQDRYRQYYGYGDQYDHSYNFPKNHFQYEQFYQERNFYPNNREYFRNHYGRPKNNDYWRKQKPKPFWLIQTQRQRYTKAPSYKKAKQQEQKKNQKADDDELLFLIDQIDKNIENNDFDNDSVSDDFGNQLAKQASFIRNKFSHRITSEPKSSHLNTKENGRNLDDY